MQTPFGQNFISHQVTRRLSKDLNTRIAIDRVDFSLFNNMHLQGVLVEDHERDTLLYAGEIRVKITDWFFFKDNIVLKYIGVSNAVIYTHREDSVWNYQFLIDYFSSPSGGKSGGGTQLNLEKIDLRNIAYRKKDAWLGQDMVVSVGSMNLEAKNINFSNRSISLGSLVLDEPRFSQYNYDKLKPTSLAPPLEDSTIVVDSLLKWNAAGWVVNVDRLDITNGSFRSARKSASPLMTGFDGKNVYFTDINATLSGIRWEKDTVTAGLVLKTKERSGFEVKGMKSNVRITPADMTFADLEIRTNNSMIRNYFRMSYDDISSMGDFIHAVKMEGRFVNSQIDSDDIAYFAPALKSWKKNISLNGVVRGAVDDLAGKDLMIKAGNNTLLNGDISMTGLPDINQTFIDFKANDFHTIYEDVASFVPSVRTVRMPDLRKLQYIQFKGSFTGFTRDFVTFGTIETSLGVVKSDLNMKLPEVGDAIYSGTISTDYFRLGDFIDDKQIGIISLDGSLKGRGFNAKSRNTEIDGKIRFVDYNGYRYQNITMNGTLDKKKFEGMASINDPEAELTLNGLIDFNLGTPRFNFVADVTRANLKKLNLYKDDLAFSGKFNLDFSGDNIDNFLGSARITQASLQRNGVPLPFDSLSVSSTYENNSKTIQVNSNEIDILLKGNYAIRDLPDAFKLFLNKYYPAYIKAPYKTPENESIHFDITTRNVEDFVRLVDSSLSGFNNSHLVGDLDTRASTLNLEADVPQFKYQRYNFDDVKVTATGTRDSISVFGGASNVNISDSLNVPLTLFRISAHNDTSHVYIYTGANQAINQANINAQVLTYSNGVRIEVDPSTLVVNGKTWTIEENGELEFRSNIPASGQLVLKETQQEIRIKTVPSETGDWNNVVVDLKKVNIGDFSPFFLPRNRLEGLLSGSIHVEDPVNNLYARSEGLNIEALRLDNDSIGELKTDLTYNGKTKELTGSGFTVNEENKLAFDLKLFLANAESQKQNLVSLKANRFKLDILERFLGTLFSDMQGYVTGDFDLKGQFSNLEITGKGRLIDAGLKVNFTQCFYKIQDTDLELKPTELDLTGIVLTDPVSGNPVYLTGNIQHTGFKNMFFDLTVGTRKPNTSGPRDNLPVLLLNTSFNDNKQFFGKVMGTGSFSLAGPQSDLFMKIDAIASTTDSSTVTIPSSTSRESGIADFLVEKKYGVEMVDNSFGSGAANVIYDVDVTANPMVTVRVILDDLTGDEIKGKGTGTLNIHSGTNEKLAMRGRFDIEEGEYQFTFQSFFRKPFRIVKGTENYITWSGDPMAAKIKFEAQYTAVDVSYAPLASVLQDNSGISRVREDVYVVADLSGELFKPSFKFRLEFPSNSVTRNDFSIASNIELIEKNDNEINRQVTYLIVFNSFAPPETGPATTGFGSAINEVTYNTISSISGLFFNEINRKLNNELSKILKNDNISINFSGSVYNRNLLNQSSTFNINQGNVYVNVPISLFRDRFVVTLGSTLDVPLQATIQQNVQFLPDVTAEWLINQSGTIRASFFYRQNLDYLTNATGAARTKRSGASIAYRKEFDKLGELLGNKKRKKDIAPKSPPVDSLPPKLDSLIVVPVY
ncbi:MAG: translocation/assembly module TamB domain-containing protein [Chitinophagaceae bacterium]